MLPRDLIAKPGKASAFHGVIENRRSPTHYTAKLTTVQGDEAKASHMADHVEEIISYYTEAGPDYSVWSRRFNMHFGMYRKGMNPFKLEAMLERMNLEVISLLRLQPACPQLVLDMGCGLGATARYAASKFSNLRVIGITLVPLQARRATQLTEAGCVSERVTIVAGDYTATPFPDATFDGVYALESSCYAPGHSKELLLREMHRVLKPGGRFVVADAFLKTMRTMNPVTRRCYRTLCKYWALEEWGEIHQFVACAEKLGFTGIQAENISSNVTPSVLHTAPTIFRFLTKQAKSKSVPMTSRRRGHLMAGVLLSFFALDRSRSGYFTVVGIKM
jgi:MPBQ/MSBQ methyltransferase